WFDVLFGGIAFGYLAPGEGAGALGKTSTTAMVPQPDRLSISTGVTDLSPVNLRATDLPLEFGGQAAVPSSGTLPSAVAVDAHFATLDIAAQDLDGLGGLRAGLPAAFGGFGGEAFGFAG